MLEVGASASEKLSMDEFWTYFWKQWLQITNNWNIREDDGHFLQMVNRTNNALECYNCRFNSIFLKTPSLIEFNELVKNESLQQEEILNDIRSGRHRDKDCQKMWIPDIPLSYYDFKSNQEDGEDPFPGGHATTNPEDSLDLDALMINRKVAKPHSNILKKACIVHVENKQAKIVSIAKPATIKTKPTKRPAEPLGFVSENVGCPKRKTKKPKKSLP